MISAETAKAGVDAGVSLELLEDVDERLDGVEGVQGAEGMLDADPPRRQRR